MKGCGRHIVSVKGLKMSVRECMTEVKSPWRSLPLRPRLPSFPSSATFLSALGYPLGRRSRVSGGGMRPVFQMSASDVCFVVWSCFPAACLSACRCLWTPPGVRAGCVFFPCWWKALASKNGVLWTNLLLLNIFSMLSLYYCRNMHYLCSAFEKEGEWQRASCITGSSMFC